MDPIDRLSDLFLRECLNYVRTYTYIRMLFDSSSTVNEALQHINAIGLGDFVDGTCPQTVRKSINTYTECIGRMDDIKRFARKVFALNFAEIDQYYVFNQEVSFSYACKFISSTGPPVRMFFSSPTKYDVICAEVYLALQTPLFAADSEDDLYCFERIEDMDWDHDNDESHVNSAMISTCTA